MYFRKGFAGKAWSLVLAICTVAALSSLVGFSMPAAAADAAGTQDKTGVHRIWGENRFETAFKVSDAVKAEMNIGKYEAIVIACGKDFPDALSGSYLAAVKNAPILMAHKEDDLQLLQYVSENLQPGGKVYLLGGYEALPEGLDQCFSGFETSRLMGSNRLETNLEILREASVTGGEILVCTALDFADCLSVSAVDKPVLLVNNRSGTLTQSQKDFLQSLKNVKFYIIGGEKAVNHALENQLKQFGPIQRIGGENRMETSVLVAKAFFNSPKNAVLAYALNFPDGLCGGPLGYQVEAPVILTMDGYEAAAKAYIAENRITNGFVLGGSKLISDETVKAVFAMPAGEDVPALPSESYRIDYVLNNGINSHQNPAGYSDGDTIKLQAPSRENHEFKGWYLDKGFQNKIDTIGPELSSDLTLYAKWHLKAININGTGMDDMIWSWWYHPQVISDSSQGTKVFWGYSTSEGYCGVAVYDDETGAVQKNSLKRLDKVDDHNGLALTLLEDKRILCAYAGGHDNNNEIHIRISDRPLDISSFTNNIVLESSGKTCYSQIVKANGRYYLFYRRNSRNWVYRSSADGIQWTGETLFVKASDQYYCRAVPTTDGNLIRVLMYSNPTAAAPEIRMGFLDARDGSVYNSDAVTKLSSDGNSYDSFHVLLDVPAGKTQRLFDAAITDPGKPMFLYTVFSKTAGSDDSIYYLFDTGNSYEICKGGKPLWDPKYQLGASFVDQNTIVAGRNELGADYIEVYSYDGTAVKHTKTVDVQPGSATSRNARPIVDVNGKAILWHNGYYNPKVYTDFSTSARLHFLGTDSVIMESGIALDADEMAKPKDENVRAVRSYAAKLYEENTMSDYTKGGFNWDLTNSTQSWLYYTGLVFDGMLTLDFDTYYDEIKNFYDQHINNNGSVKNYIAGELDAALVGVGFARLLNSEVLNAQEKTSYEAALNYVYNQLEQQTIYPQAGKLWLHSQKADGTPRPAWTKWNICLDGIYMSQLFLIRLAETIDNGNAQIRDKNGLFVTTDALWNDIFTRLDFAAKNMRNAKNGLLYHGYCVATGETNEASWSRGIGWFAMVLLEAAEKIPDTTKRQVLLGHYRQIMDALLEWQDPVTFLWYNVTDGREEYKYVKVTDGTEEIIPNKPESSGSAMFAYCLLRGYHSGLLPQEGYRAAGLRAFNALVETKLTPTGLCDIYSSSSVTSDKNLYQKNGYVTNDGKGIGPLLLAAKYAC